jgi:hypothetical protein
MSQQEKLSKFIEDQYSILNKLLELDLNCSYVQGYKKALADIKDIMQLTKQ